MGIAVQVVQYLLAKNYHLTALELLVEAQQAGHGDDVGELQAFFSDPDRFPPEELARHQPANALDLQAIAREREARLQLAEYELRLAKEDLADMSRRLAAAQAAATAASAAASPERQQEGRSAQQPSPSSSPASARGGAPPPSDAGAAGMPPAPSAAGSAHAASPSRPGLPAWSSPAPSMASAAGPTSADLKALNAAVFAHLARQGLVTTAMTMEEEYGGPLRPPTPGPSQGPQGGPRAEGGSEPPWELWAWYQAAAREAAAAAATQAATEAAAGAAGDGTAGADAAGVEPSAFDLERELEAAAAAEAVPGADLDLDDPASATPERLRAALLEARAALSATRSRARAALASASQRQLQLQQQLLRSPAPPPLLPSPPPPLGAAQFPAGDASIMELLDLTPKAHTRTSSAADLAAAAGGAATPGGARAASSDGTAAPHSATHLAPGAAATGASPGADHSFGPGPGGALPARGSLSGGETDVDTAADIAAGGSGGASPPRPPWLRGGSGHHLRLHSDIDPAYHSSLESMLTRLTELLPRLVPSLTLKSRLEVLPLLVTAAKTSPDWGVRRQLLMAAFNLAPAPDHTQRQAVLDACLELCRAFGPGWAASELLPLCGRQASSPSAERRTLVAEALGCAVGCVEAGTQGHVLLTQLAQLARDRTEQVREAACLSLARLVPRLPFGRSYYTTLEGLLLALATDPAEPVASAALSYLVPALLTWQPTDGDAASGGSAASTPAAGSGNGGGGLLLASSCMSRVLSELGQHVRQIEQQQAAAAALAAQQTAVAAAQRAESSGGGGGGGGGFAGSFLRYGGSGQPSEAAQAPSPTPPSPPPPSAAAHPVSYGRRTFPSSAHLAAAQLLALYGGLAPALRQAAHVVPELLRALAAAGPALAPEGALELRRQAAGALAATCEALGAPFTAAALLPLFTAAAGYGLSAAALAAGGAPAPDPAAPVPVAVADAVAAATPKSPEALRTARQYVLPALLACVLPAGGLLRPHLTGLMGAAHELRHRWLMEALPEYTAALTAAATLRPAITPALLHTLEDLLAGPAAAARSAPAAGGATGDSRSSGDGAPPSTPPTAAAAEGSVGGGGGAAAGPASTSAGLCCAALARSLVPLASLEVASRRLLPGLMALMSYGEPDLQRACVGVLAELGLRFRADGPRVSEQVLVVYDSLLEQGSYAVRQEVLSCGTAMAAAAAPSAAVSAAAAAQVEVAAAAAHLGSALEALSRCKHLLPEPAQQSALSALLKERAAGGVSAGGGGGGGVSVSSSSASTAGGAAIAGGGGGNPLAAAAAPIVTQPRLSGAHQPPPPQPQPGTTTPPGAAGAPGGALPSMPPLPAGAAAGGDSADGGQPRSRFEALKQRFLKRKDEAAAASGGGGGPAPHPSAGGADTSGRPREAFFSDDEGE
ncbi:hypothetical protein GPECTOR_64g111 [Gonium pectorale]|uniref:Uncharacterized protein n=1 Tax=Gonium pectorale TaxID=33097 RepID=A0A150G434_GONPE|nr:hypothetical protein GPECTOR_64g111 [Gonium pectorale]|eukprot:KXZ44617.1 hypothetical protein GPECTOR_64g111 [Gonium pectorale]